MNEITFKVASKGEGKTKWLLNIANAYAMEGRAIFLLVNDDKQYVKFCENYFSTFKTVCPVQRLASHKLTNNDVVLIDDLLKHSTDTGEIEFLHRNCYKMFITLEGKSTFTQAKKTWDNIYEQLYIDSNI